MNEWEKNKNGVTFFEYRRLKMMEYDYLSTICLPNGVNAKPASLKCWRPNGIPMMVMQSKMPNARCVRLIQIPPSIIQRRFMMILKHPPDCGVDSIFLPKGQRAKRPIFNVWIPNGIPIMVTIMPTLATMYSTAVTTPPNTNQRIFINRFIPYCLNYFRN